MSALSFSGKTVLLTGASSGIGREMAIQLATEHRANLIIVARRESMLQELARELEGKHGVKVHVAAADLSVPADVERVIEAAREHRADMAILNAGITHFGEHLELSQESFERMLAVNVTSLVRISTELGKDFVARRAGALMFVASLAGLQPVPFQTAYSGTKGFVINYGRGLEHELGRHGVSVTTFCPGGIRTEMSANSGLDEAFDSDLLLMDPDECARDALEAMRRRRPFRVPGVLNRASTQLMRVLPTQLLVQITGWQYGRALKHAK